MEKNTDFQSELHDVFLAVLNKYNGTSHEQKLLSVMRSLLANEIQRAYSEFVNFLNDFEMFQEDLFPHTKNFPGNIPSLVMLPDMETSNELKNSENEWLNANDFQETNVKASKTTYSPGFVKELGQTIASSESYLKTTDMSLAECGSLQSALSSAIYSIGEIAVESRNESLQRPLQTETTAFSQEILKEQLKESPSKQTTKPLFEPLQENFPDQLSEQTSWSSPEQAKTQLPKTEPAPESRAKTTQEYILDSSAKRTTISLRQLSESLTDQLNEKLPTCSENMATESSIGKTEQLSSLPLTYPSQQHSNVQLQEQSSANYQKNYRMLLKEQSTGLLSETFQKHLERNIPESLLEPLQEKLYICYQHHSFLNYQLNLNMKQY